MTPLLRTGGGTSTAYAVSGPAAPSGRDLVLVHGWCCDRSTMSPLRVHFERSHRVVAVDLRGHGRSLELDDDGSSGVGCGRRADVDPLLPPGLLEVRVEDYAADLAAVCRDARLRRPVVIGHGLGGLVALEALRATDAPAGAHPAGAVLLDPAPIANAPARAFWEDAAPALARDHDGRWRRQFGAGLFPPPGPQGRPVEQTQVLELMASTPASVAAAAAVAMASYDGASALGRIGGPLLAVHAATAERGLQQHLSDPALLTVGQTVGSGHFHQLEVPEQLLPMVERWLRVSGLAKG